MNAFVLLLSLVLLSAVIDKSSAEFNLKNAIKELVRRASTRGPAQKDHLASPAPQGRLRGSDVSITEAAELKGEIIEFLTCLMLFHLIVLALLNDTHRRPWPPLQSCPR
jgi:hypothetical protein